MNAPIAEQKIVAHFADGQIMKGRAEDFFPHKEIFHITVDGSKPGEKPIEIRLKMLKAIFFVKDFTGDRAYREKRDFGQATFYGKKTIVRFKDGEVLYGFTQGYSPIRPGFFLFPSDPQTNNSRVFVIAASVRKVEVL